MSTSNPRDLAENELADNLETTNPEDTSFAEILSNFEQQHTETGDSETAQGTVVAVGSETILVDIGRKTEGILPTGVWRKENANDPAPGDVISINIGPRDSEGYYQLSPVHVVQPKDFSGLRKAFEEKTNITGTIVSQVKGGFRVDVGLPAFMPASRSGIREMGEMPKWVGQTIECRITKLDVDKEDVVVDRRVLVEEEQARKVQETFASLQVGAIVAGRVRNVMDFGAFLDLGGVDGLLHVADIAWNRIAKASDVLKPGEELTVKILKIDPNSRKISLGLKQLQEDPWTVAARTFHPGDRVSGTISRLADFGAFVELIPGIDGLIHLSEMTWDKRVRKAGDVVKQGDRVEVVVLQVNPSDKRIALGLKQAMGDPWDGLLERHPVGSIVEGAIVNLAPFGAFVDLGEGVEGMIHISDMTNEKRLEHPRELLSKGQQVRTVVLELDREKRRVRLGMRQLEPTKADLYIAEHNIDDAVTGRIVDVHGNRFKVELAEGVTATCVQRPKESAGSSANEAGSKDVSALGAMLAARWKQGPPSASNADTVKEGQVRNFRITGLDGEKKQIEIELVK